MPVGRLKPGVTLAQAQTEMEVIARQLEQAYPKSNKGIGKKLVPLHEELFGWAKKPLYPLLGAVAFVLLIACANVANLLQSRGEIRRTEYAVRASLGAGRRRLIQQLLLESGLLALLGGTLGIVLSFGGVQLFLKLAGDIPSSQNIKIDAAVLFFTLAVSLTTAIVFGLVPAIQASKPDLNLALREGARRTSSGSRSLTRHVLAVLEIALAMVLLIGAGLMISSVLRLQKVKPGFDPSNLLTMQIHLDEGSPYVQRVPGGDMEKAMPAVTNFYQQLLERAAALPGVESVGSSTGLPTHFGAVYTFSILGHTVSSPDQRPEAGYEQVSPGLFRTLRIPLKKGRYLDDHDNPARPGRLSSMKHSCIATFLTKTRSASKYSYGMALIPSMSRVRGKSSALSVTLRTSVSDSPLHRSCTLLISSNLTFIQADRSSFIFGRNWPSARLRAFVRRICQKR